MLIQVNVEGVKQNIEQNLVPRNEDGRPVTNLLATMTDGVYDIDTKAEEAEAEAKVVEEATEAKVTALSVLTVTTESGKVFYANTESRLDLQAAIDGADLKGTTSTLWKLAKEFEGARVVEVSLDEIREASALALEAKAGLVGVL